ncbi:uncharacterized protein L969DRAFT_49754 [Mixia osmundae IAM 14324]|uniref:Uncharacterized protein n=1 Tax=Mixia osmundae (strain CBS 9802 / IAM 14324 / JCM 22182 / KY 12970) TaxID=764103 RepID=G7E125_MIXOS|nr:uncharacterized protein L969DRAFT_49754 [Mixia osmundae IAM 14324]KEI38829.1 hypothetical protein L969DRAFT_49754 [Mixia osmundae IAM 14324]GAA96535.1 hypothetical protein E5Q_03203 [Mixia osmundae IAM 14324]
MASSGGSVTEEEDDDGAQLDSETQHDTPLATNSQSASTRIKTESPDVPSVNPVRQKLEEEDSATEDEAEEEPQPVKLEESQRSPSQPTARNSQPLLRPESQIVKSLLPGGQAGQSPTQFRKRERAKQEPDWDKLDDPNDTPAIRRRKTLECIRWKRNQFAS